MATVASLDLTQLAHNLGYAAGNIEPPVQQLLQDVGQQITDTEKQLAPWRTGNLVSHIQMIVERLRVTVGPQDVDYAGYVVFGTQPHVIKPKVKQALAFKSGGKTVIVKQVKHPGTKPNPFPQMAAQEFLDGLGDQAALIGVNMALGSRNGQ